MCAATRLGRSIRAAQPPAVPHQAGRRCTELRQLRCSYIKVSKLEPRSRSPSHSGLDAAPGSYASAPASDATDPRFGATCPSTWRRDSRLRTASWLRSAPPPAPAPEPSPPRADGAAWLAEKLLLRPLDPTPPSLLAAPATPSVAPASPAAPLSVTDPGPAPCAPCAAQPVYAPVMCFADSKPSAVRVGSFGGEGVAGAWGPWQACEASTGEHASFPKMPLAGEQPSGDEAAASGLRRGGGGEAALKDTDAALGAAAAAAANALARASVAAPPQLVAAAGSSTLTRQGARRELANETTRCSAGCALGSGASACTTSSSSPLRACGHAARSGEAGETLVA